MPEATDSSPAAPVAPAPRKGTVQIIDGKKIAKELEQNLKNQLGIKD